MNQRVGIDVQANIQGVQQATNTTAAGVDNIGKAADKASARIKELEKALEFSRLETKARDMIIDKAEEYFDIQIRKKSGAK